MALSSKLPSEVPSVRRGRDPLRSPAAAQREPVWSTLVFLAVVTVPFQYALTIDVGSPVKVSEILLVLALAARLLSPGSTRTRVPGLGFVVLLAVALVVSGLYWLGFAGPVRGLDFTGYTRSPSTDLLFYTAFGLFALLGWWMFSQLGRDRFERAIILSIWLAGAATLLQFVGALLGLETLLADLGFRSTGGSNLSVTGVNLRSGPFLEGQHLGFYAGAALLIALKRRSWLPAIVAALLVFYSQSTTAVLGIVVAGAILFLLRPHVRVLAAILSLTLLVGGLAAFVAPVRQFVINQAAKLGLVSQTAEFRFAGLSFDVREEKASIGAQMGIDHLALGVGPGRFGAWFSQYADYTVLPAYYRTTDLRPIAENVYLQIFAEMGVLALIGLIGLLLVLLVRALRATPIVFAIGVCVAVGLWTQSSWTFLPIWVFLAYVGVAASDPDVDRKAAVAVPERPSRVPSDRLWRSGSSAARRPSR
ncbi:hypothetical protein GTU73_07770 [Rathayibacter sp. VKM Ac-2804]|uniref:O-antigen ligase family protein n=1 Tax=Rathayibacter sp. VKM Ac-2804 TaxID=2609257 RepID=UPI00132EBA73|nr:O-antigen ligase family protein [Rathayibacter sp. VKM Ac-2804]QHF23914.1 hypothetical protein GTU73_07770 [Rathayibacter sp. VKM Ac-2804]